WLNGNLSFSNIRGNHEAIICAQRSSVRYFQRPDASHVTLDSSRTSMSGHGGTFSIGRSGNSPWNMGLTGTWRSPDFELNDLGFLRQADVFMQTSWIGYQSNNPS
ncbi:MAG: hydrolase, partial [Candidatus Latescibacteria bacterium]|nr:hydrolase [Candidatus Latescibacterota bacterium]